MFVIRNCMTLRLRISHQNRPEAQVGRRPACFASSPKGIVCLPLSRQPAFPVGPFIQEQNRPLCAVYARRLDVQAAALLFDRTLSHSPKPSVVVEKQPEIDADSPVDGKIHTVSYTWDITGNAAKKMLCMMTTSAAADAQIQAMASASMLQEGEQPAKAAYPSSNTQDRPSQP